jgi:type III restriction enzyme
MNKFACACWLDTQAQRGRLTFWVRNLVRREGWFSSCKKPMGDSIGTFSANSRRRMPRPALSLPSNTKAPTAGRPPKMEDDRLIGGLWAELSGGHCRFVMVKEQCWDRIEEWLP